MESSHTQSASSTGQPAPRHSKRNNEHNKRPSYSLFPTVKIPSPLLITSPQHKRLASTPDHRRKRSSSVDESTRLAGVRQSYAASAPSVRSSKSSNTIKAEDRPSMESTTFAALPNVRRSIYTSSSSGSEPATGDITALPSWHAQPASSNPRSTWMSKQATHHPCVTGHDLGFSLFPPAPPTPVEEQPCHRPSPQRRTKAKTKPNLTIQVMNTYQERPPPPPPKSPRYSSNSSVQSSVSSTRESSPASSAPTSPGSVVRSAVVYAQSSTMLTTSNDFHNSGLRCAEQWHRPTRHGPTQSINLNWDEPAPKPRIIDINKPVPNLPLPSSRFSPYAQQQKAVVVEGNGERTPKAVSPAIDPCGLPYTDAESAFHALSTDTIEEKVPRGPSPVQSVRAALEIASSQATVLQQELAPIDPVKVLKDSAEQMEGIHTRYATLRSARLKLSSAVSSSLREHKSGPEYGDALLDQILELNALNSSMDICFARLKALDCKREEAIAALLARDKEGYDTANRVPTIQSDDSKGSDKRQTVIHSASPSIPLSPIYRRDDDALAFPIVAFPPPPPRREPPCPPAKDAPKTFPASRPSRSPTESSCEDSDIETPNESDVEGLFFGKTGAIPSIEVFFDDRVIHYCNTPSPEW